MERLQHVPVISVYAGGLCGRRINYMYRPPRGEEGDAGELVILLVLGVHYITAQTQIYLQLIALRPRNSLCHFRSKLLHLEAK